MSKAVRMRRTTLDLSDGQVSLCMWRGPENAPVLHWAHANGFNGQTYAPLLSQLSDRFHVYAWDARGHGQTTLVADPDQMRDWNIYREDMIQVIEALRVRHAAPILLGGHSMGGCVSVMTAAQRPDLVKGLVLADPVIIPFRYKLAMRLASLLGPRGEGMKLADMARRRRALWPDIKTLKAAYTGRGAFKTWQTPFLTAYLKGGTLPTEDGVSLACAPAWEAANFEAFRHDSIGPVKQLRVPFTLLMAEVGSTTRVPHLFAANAARRAIQRVPSTSHFLPMEVPELVTAAVRDLADHLGLAPAV
jgi:pimeloyl-ACP methyl ester carboxylesterase